MARFYFHLLAGSGRIEDETGLELSGAADATEQGRRAISELRDEDPDLVQGFALIEIRDAAGELLLKAPLGRRRGAA